MTFQRINAGTGHYYKIDGAKVDSVTELIRGGWPPDLTRAAAVAVAEQVADHPDDIELLRDGTRLAMVESLAGEPQRKWRAKRDRGTAVHAEINDDDGHTPWPADLGGFERSYRAWRAEWRPRVLFSESPVGSRQERYGGTLDELAIVPGMGVQVVDYKTGDEDDRPWPEVALQLAAYRHAEWVLGAGGDVLPLESFQIRGGLVVHLRPDGYEVHRAECGQVVFRDFLQVAAVARARRDRAPSWLSTPLLPPLPDGD